MVSSKLTPFQREVLDAVFARVDASVFLTGGAALAGYHIGHLVVRLRRAALPQAR